MFWLSVTSGLRFRTFEQKTARALAKKLLLTEFPPEPLTEKQVNVTDLYPMVSSTNFAQKGSTPLNNGSTKAPDKKCLSMTSPPEPMVQNLQ